MQTKHLYRKLAESIIPNIENYNARELCTIALAYARSNRVHSRLFDAIAARLVLPPVRATMTPADIALVVLSFCNVAASATSLLLKELAPVIRGAVAVMSDEELTRVLQAFSLVRVPL